MKKYYEVTTTYFKHQPEEENTIYAGFDLEKAKKEYRSEMFSSRRDKKFSNVELRVLELPDDIAEDDEDAIDEVICDAYMTGYNTIECCKYEVRNRVSTAEQSRGEAPHDEIPENYVGDYVEAWDKDAAIDLAIEYLVGELDSNLDYEKTADGFKVFDEDENLISEYWDFEARRACDVDADGNAITDDWGTKGI